MNHIQKKMHTDASVYPQILVMEDEPHLAKGIQMVLTDEGYAVDVAMSGRGAIDLFQQKMFDLLIADLRLPDIDGMDVISQVKRNRPETGVVVISGYSTLPTAVKAMKLGAFDFIAKPFTDDEIKSAVIEALKEKKEIIAKEELWPAKVEEEREERVFEALVSEDKAVLAKPLAEIHEKFKGNPDDLIPMLQHVQNSIGYLPKEALLEIARLTKLPTANVFGVATFYEQFRFQPAGKHIIKICRGTACHVRGSDQILNDLKARLHLTGKTTKDRMFTVDTVACFGSCALAPVLVADNSVYGRVNLSKAEEIIGNLQE
jgi:NADH-quinone oxidoreductase subunit E